MFDAALAAGWGTIQSGVAEENARDKLRLLMALPEAGADDSSGPEYFGMIVLQILGYALRMAMGDEPPDAVRSACFAALDLCAELDVDVPSRTVAHDEQPWRGAIESTELLAARESLRLLQDLSADTRRFESVRISAAAVSPNIESAISKLSLERGWHIE